MKVRCTKIINPITGEIDKTSSWLTIDKIYQVLSVSVNPGKSIYFQIVDDGKSPGLHDSRQFSVVSDKISSNWVIMTNKQGGVWIGPEKWTRSAFWEDYYNDVPEAIRDFKEEQAKIDQENNYSNPT